MLTYLDRTFCNAEECLNFSACDRALSQEVRDRAAQWWGTGNAPIAFYGEPKSLPCFRTKPLQSDDHGEEKP